MKLNSIKIYILLLIFSPSVYSLGEDYAKAWPRQVKVEKPDPVFGNKTYWEHWIYSEGFAKRFKGFDLQGANPDLNNDIKAMVLRVNKQDVFFGKKTGHLKQYICELDIYFDSKIVLPYKMSKHMRSKLSSPLGMPSSYKRLVAVNNKEQKIIDSMVIPENRPVLDKSVAIFSNPIDGRFNKFNTMEYHHDFIDGMSLIILSRGSQCGMTAPLAKGGAHWISLSGKLPIGYGGEFATSITRENSYRDDYKKIDFAKHLNSKSPGFNKIPNNFSNTILPKVALVKVMNICIQKKQSFPEFKSRYEYNEKTDRNIERMDNINEIESRCADIRKNGILTDPYLFRDRDVGLDYEKY